MGINVVTGLLVTARKFVWNNQPLFKRPTFRSDDVEDCGSVNSYELCLVLAVHQNRIMVISPRGEVGWRPIHDFNVV